MTATVNKASELVDAHFKTAKDIVLDTGQAFSMDAFAQSINELKLTVCRTHTELGFIMLLKDKALSQNAKSTAIKKKLDEFPSKGLSNSDFMPQIIDESFIVYRRGG